MRKLLCLMFLVVANFGQAHDLSICAIFKNEAPYLKEWIEFHRCVGVEHFYLFNNDSTDNYQDVLQMYIDAGIVEVENAINQLDFNGTQVDCYNRGLIKSRGVSSWVAFIDTDEFIMPSEDVNLAWLLSHYHFAGVAVNWRSFGTSNIAKLNPNEPMVGQLTTCVPYHYPTNVHVKSIVRPELVMQFCGPHNPVYVPGWHAVDVGMVPQEGPLSNSVKLDPIRINHYWTRDEYYFNHFKKPRRLAWGDTEESLNRALIELNAEHDGTMIRYVPRLKQVLGM